MYDLAVDDGVIFYPPQSQPRNPLWFGFLRERLFLLLLLLKSSPRCRRFPLLWAAHSFPDPFSQLQKEMMFALLHCEMLKGHS